MAAAVPVSTARGERHQHIAGVRDGAVGQHALDVGLQQRGEIADASWRASAQTHTSGSQRSPIGSKAVMKMRRKTAKAAAFGPADRNAETGVGAPW